MITYKLLNYKINIFDNNVSCFYNNKKVMLLNNVYEPYADEIVGWGVTCLYGNLDNII